MLRKTTLYIKEETRKKAKIKLANEGGSLTGIIQKLLELWVSGKVETK